MRVATVHWFRRDFRIHDNVGLAAAARDRGAVVGVFVIDPRWFGAKTGKMGPHQAMFWLESLRELQGALKGRGIALVVRTEWDPVRVLLKVAEECGATAITFNREYEPAQLAMDERLTVEGEAAGVRVLGFKDAVIFEEEELLTGSGSPYSVFTPYKNAYLKKLGDAVEVGGIVRKSGERKMVRSEGVPTAKELGFEEVALDVEPGEKAGARMLARFCEKGLEAYKEARDFPALGLRGEGTSRLSAHLNAGTVSIRQAMRAALDHAKKAGEGATTWIGELVWRDFYRMVLFHHPETVAKPFQKQYEHVTWGNDPELIAAWSEGRTGYPLVDAAMKQIRATGFMHNRLRMIAAMFLTKDLDVHWVVGERLFRQWLMDYDEACNVGGWQWAASTGTDAAPYFRVMNPVLQSERFDPEGEFLRHWLPALRKVPVKYVHAPWEMPAEVQKACGCVIGRDYPGPVVDHAEAKERAVAKFRRVTRG
jgi:deoxyribodipyrimidine photo-lyase